VRGRGPGQATLDHHGPTEGGSLSSRRALATVLRSLPRARPAIPACSRIRLQVLIAFSFLDRVEIFALQVFDQRQFRRLAPRPPPRMITGT